MMKRGMLDMFLTRLKQGDFSQAYDVFSSSQELLPLIAISGAVYAYGHFRRTPQIGATRSQTFLSAYRKDFIDEVDKLTGLDLLVIFTENYAADKEFRESLRDLKKNKK